jgi:diguanylate cyclase (GGDEF)-like protein
MQQGKGDCCMKGIVVKIYLVLVVICLFVLGSSLLSFRNVVTQRQVMGEYRVLTDYEYHKYLDSSAPAGVREEYTFHINDIDGAYRELVFYTIHQNVDVYASGERVYRVRPFRNNDFGSTPGCVWNNIALEDADSEREVRVVIYPVYSSSIGVAPTFYFGEQYGIAMHIILKELPTLLLSVIGILAGILFACYAIYNSRSPQMDKSLVMLGIFAIVISLWKLTDDAALYLIFPDVQALYLVPLLLLHLVPAPFILFVRELDSNRDSRIWDIPIWMSFVGFVVTVLLQILHIRDVRQLLWLVHGELIISGLVTLGMLLREIHRRGMNAKLRRNLFFLSICLLGMAVDIVVYYARGGMAGNVLGMVGFITYIFAMGAYSVKDAKELIDIGVQAKNFERKAYHDQLTGLNNRMAYADYISRENFTPEHCIIAMFDLNNLKKCNDTLGHEKGDIYIRECAGIIQDTFQDIGQCYRMGGDEFCVLMEHVTLDVCRKRMSRLQEAVKERNRKHPEIEMGIACGYEFFDSRIDHDINDTSRRADKMMYREKFAMKQALAARES